VHGASGLTRPDVERALAPLTSVLAHVPESIRVVGTASSLLRGIDLPVGDVDVLARDRGTVMRLSTAAADAGAACLVDPTEAGPQYFAEFETAGVHVSFSTVEVAGSAVGECIGAWPWRHFDLIELGGSPLPLVASELRLLSEVMRLRPDRWEPIGRHLSEVGVDDELFAAALSRLEAHPSLQEIMRDAIRPSADRNRG